MFYYDSGLCGLVLTQRKAAFRGTGLIGRQRIDSASTSCTVPKVFALNVTPSLIQSGYYATGIIPRASGPRQVVDPRTGLKPCYMLLSQMPESHESPKG